MNTRVFVFFCLLPTFFLLTVSRIGAQQPKKVARIGVFERPGDSGQFEAFLGELHKLGYIEGQNVVFEYVLAGEKPDRVREQAAKLVRLKPDVIVTGGTSRTRALKNATTAIPIVVYSASDLVGRGLVASLARPGGNVTGSTSIAPDISGKRLELLKEVLPEASRVAFLHRPTEQDELKAIEVAAKVLAVKIQGVEVEESTQFESAFASMVKEQADGVLIARDRLTNEHQRQVIELAVKHRLPAVCEGSDFANAGCLMSYAPDRAELFRRAAHYVDKILKGADPATLPVEQPTKFELVVNLKTAKQIGVRIPDSVLFRADKVIK